MFWAKIKLVAPVCAATLCVSTSSFTASAAPTDALGQNGGSVILVLDGSGSMKESSGGGETRMEAAKRSLGKVVDGLPAESSVGLRVYGSTIEDGPDSCKDSTLLVPVRKVDKSALKAGIEKLKPLGNTPISYSLKQAVKDLPKDGPRSIVLVTDGEENCGGNPCKVARDLKRQGTDLVVDVVGLQVDAKARNQLTCIASAGGGTYYDVEKVEELPFSLERASIRGARGYEPAGKPVEGGTSDETAAKINDGQWLDTIGDSGAEIYQIPDPGKSTLHISASTRPSSGSSTSAEVLTVQIKSARGDDCGEVDGSLSREPTTRGPRSRAHTH